MSIKREVIEITPQLAVKFLEKNLNNRNVSRHTVNAYSIDMLTGNWSLTHQGIAFYEDGSLADGQHRLHAIIKSGVSILCEVTTGLKRTDGMNIDNHRMRSTHDALRIGGEDDITSRKISVSTARILIHVFRKSLKASNYEIFDYINRYRQHFLFAIQSTPYTKKGMAAPFVAAIISAHESGISEQTLKEFIEVVDSGISQQTYHITGIRLRDYLLTNSQNRGSHARKEAFLKCQRAIQAFNAKNSISRIFAPEHPIYIM